MAKTEIVVRKGGWRMDRVDYSAPVMRFLGEVIRNRRPSVAIGNDAKKGSRFRDDGAVVARVVSNYTEEEFMADPVLTVDAMLVDAAQSDWWYSYEKRYDDEHYGDESEDGGDDE